MEETKVFRTFLINFLCFQFPSAAAFFSTPPPKSNQPPPPPNQQHQLTHLKELETRSSYTYQKRISLTGTHQWNIRASSNKQISQVASRPTTPLPLLSPLPHKSIHQDAEGKRLSNGSSSATVPPAQNNPSKNLPSGRGDPLEVPGNRLPETGSRRTLPPARGACFDQRPRIHSGRKFKYLPRHLPRQARKIQQGVRYDQHILPNTIEPGARQNKAHDISRADPKPKHAKPTWSTSLSREKSYFIRITLLYDF
ncbi:hypothetical protein V6N12_035453 [Hibiscus sabdariffa]|uniref:Uncharacterized protein n=1 Tax=Hibiscus sabdariffa TaxID=183260 RepID=A0ABR2EMS8_9ROSI